MFPATLTELSSNRMREMRRDAARQRRYNLIVSARRWERLANRADQRARRSRDGIT